MTTAALRVHSMRLNCGFDLLSLSGEKAEPSERNTRVGDLHGAKKQKIGVDWQISPLVAGGLFATG